MSGTSSRHVTVRLPLLAAAALLIFTFSLQAAEKRKSTAESDEKAIRATADEFVKAFNAADAKAVGALWAPDAEYTDESGQSFQGRAAIEKEYADAFKQHLGAIMTLKIESIRFLGPDIALEKGVARVKSPGGLADTTARYTVVHAKRDGKWIMVLGGTPPMFRPRTKIT